jgi:hypothetical protein
MRLRTYNLFAISQGKTQLLARYANSMGRLERVSSPINLGVDVEGKTVKTAAIRLQTVSKQIGIRFALMPC